VEGQVYNLEEVDQAEVINEQEVVEAVIFIPKSLIRILIHLLQP